MNEPKHEEEQPTDTLSIRNLVKGFIIGYAGVYALAILIGLLLAGAMLLFGSCLAALR